MTDRKVSDPAWREAPRSIFSCELGERLVADPTFHRGGYLQQCCIENGDKKSLRAKVYTDRHVYDIQYCSISDVCDHCFVKCKVISTANAKKNPTKQMARLYK